MKLANLSVDRPVFISMIIVAVLMFGAVSLPMLSIDLYPELNLPVAVAVTSYPDATPEEVEKLVTKPMEETLGTVSNVKTIQSNSVSGASQVIIQFNWGTDMDQATLDMREKIDLIREVLPEEAKAPRVLRLDPNSMPIITFALSGSKDVVGLKQTAEQLIKPRLERIDGVASVGINGGWEREIQVILNPSSLLAYGLTPDVVYQSLQRQNLSGSAGKAFDQNKQMAISVDGQFESVEQIEKTSIRLPSGGRVQLKDIADVKDGYKDVQTKTFVGENPSIGITILKATGGNTVKVAEDVFGEIDKLGKQLPSGMKIDTILDTSVFIKNSIKTVTQHAVEGGILAIIILFLFLNSVRSVLVVSIVIPISVIATFSMMYFTGQTINMISLGGLTLGLGSLVDFAVVVIENIYRKRQEGYSLLDAAKDGTSEVGTAVMASALAQISVFLPIVFVEGLASELFGPMAMTVVLSHIAALFAAITLVPMMSSKWLKDIPQPEEELLKQKSKNPIVLFNKGFYHLSQGYGKMVRWALHHRKTVVISTIVIFAASVSLVPMVGMEFIPKMDQGDLTVDIKLPSGSKLEKTEQVVSKVEKIVMDIPEKSLVYTIVGGNNSPSLVATSMTNQASVQLKLVPKTERSRSTEDVVEELRKEAALIPGAEIKVNITDTSGAPAGKPIDISIQGDDLGTLKRIGDAIADEVKQVEGTRNVATSLEKTQDEFKVSLKEEIAPLYGVETGQVISAVRTAFGGSVATLYRTGDDEIDVKVSFPDSWQNDPTYIEGLMMTTPTGAKVPVGLVAQVKKIEVPQAIQRKNQARMVSVQADYLGSDLGSVMQGIEEKIGKLQLPEGYMIETGGQSKDMQESFGNLGLAMILSIALVYMVMAAQFESLFYPFVIMFSIPPTFIGVMIGLVATGKSLSVPALIGVILLIGIVVNNAIVLIDYVNTLRKRGMNREEAILKAGPVRLRPILMTTLTTVLAILPLAFGGGEGNEAQAPMAIVVAFGLTFSTLVTLILVPVVYSIFDDWIEKWKNRREKKRNARDIKIGA